uniref:Uncharacterized protein n=1 Tax=Arundo donax TaxID=35708 RepID=A0A0A9EMQ5_ARUDO
MSVCMLFAVFMMTTSGLQFFWRIPMNRARLLTSVPRDCALSMMRSLVLTRLLLPS